MIISSHKQPKHSSELINFLKFKLELSDSEINLGVRQSESEQAPLAIVLWTFGIINLDQYQRLLNWLKDHS